MTKLILLFIAVLFAEYILYVSVLGFSLIAFVIFGIVSNYILWRAL